MLTDAISKQAERCQWRRKRTGKATTEG